MPNPSLMKSRRVSWRSVMTTWEWHFTRMAHDPAYAAWIIGGEVGPCPPVLYDEGTDDMGLFGGAPSVAPPPPPPPPPAPIQAANATSQVAGSAARSAASAAQGQGFDNTITNSGGPQGQTSTPVGQKSLLGQ